MEEIDTFRRYTAEEASMVIGCSLKTLLPILKKMSKEKRSGVKEKGETYIISGGEIKCIKYGLRNKRYV